MARKSKNNYIVKDDIVQISREEWPNSVYTSYREDYFTEMTSVTWGIPKLPPDSKKKPYPVSKKLGSLHRYIAEKWYGKEMFDEMSAKGFIVEHLDNDHMNCRIDNLYFLSSDENKAKGFTVDKKRQELLYHIAVGLYRDFTTNCFQITIFFNDYAELFIGDEKFQISVIKLLYNIDYKLVINDAKSILDNYELNYKIDFTKLNYCKMKYEKARYVILTPEEQESKTPIVFRDGRAVLVFNGNAFHHGVKYDKGWNPDGSDVK